MGIGNFFEYSPAFRLQAPKPHCINWRRRPAERHLQPEDTPGRITGKEGPWALSGYQAYINVPVYAAVAEIGKTLSGAEPRYPKSLQNHRLPVPISDLFE